MINAWTLDFAHAGHISILLAGKPEISGYLNLFIRYTVDIQQLSSSVKPIFYIAGKWKNAIFLE